MKWVVEETGKVTLYDGSLPVLTGYARASDVQGRSVDTRTAKVESASETPQGWELTFRSADGLLLRQILSCSGSAAFVRCILSDADGSVVESNDLVPLVMCAKSDDSPYMWRGLQAKMLVVPYDNDMWSRYEAVSFLTGRKSADMTVLFSEESFSWK